MACLAASTVALAAVGGASPAFGVDIPKVNGDGRAVGHATTGSPAKRGPTKLTMGLDTLSAEYQAYRQAVASGTAKAATFATTQTMARVIGDAVVIDAVAADDPQVLKAALEALGAEVIAVAGRIVSARLPLDKIPKLDDLCALKFARPAMAAK